MSKTALEVLKERRSIRKYLDKPIPDELLDQVLEAGSYAPTGNGTQGVQIVAVSDPEDVKTLNELNGSFLPNPTSTPYYGAPTIILVLATPEARTPVYDGSAVITNIVNAAYAVGLGSCWIFRCDKMFDSDKGKELLKKWGLSTELKGLTSCAIGYPAVETPKAPPRRAGMITKIK